jgi:MFS family permease
MIPALRAFRHRSFRIFFAGQGLSVLGSWMQTVATSWLVYRLSGSALLLGVAAGALQLPMLFLSPIAGVWADRLDRRRLLIIVQSFAAAQAIALAALVFAGVVAVWHVIGISLVLGAVNAIETPTRQAFLLELVGSKDDLPNAIALQSLLFNGARFIGPTIAGLILAVSSEAWCFLLNGLSYIAVVCAYWLIRVATRPPKRTAAPLWSEIAGGFRYAFGSVATRRLIVLLAAVSFFSAPWQSLMPIYAGKTFAGDSRTLGMLIGAVGLGGIVALAVLAVRPSVRGLGRIIAACSVLAGLALTGFALSQLLWLSLALLPLFGFGLITSVASSNTILQTIADEDKRGRIISIYVMTFLGIAPISNLLAGAIAEAIGVRWTMFGCGLGLTAATAWFALNLASWRAAVRPIYMKQGIIPKHPDRSDSIS